MVKPLKARRFSAEDLYQPCIACGEVVSKLDGQSQGWLHNACAKYMPSDAELRFRAENDARKT